ncbi:hypothetical protein PY093_15725 [Cytobacillus sp. S13-E01]|uniref:hypothetical protein n=1 Tax=Cytobacillus sp. S13-E01 TaxID=3031326 RepID=UPI0023D84039|nr:hypothetical protein [Cytobacillus sp. S13-E01]MDF0728118.1 hypothetical protein [Cytobacillus sp. S13-E01]
MTKYMGLHETLEVHELLVFKNLCLTKSVAMSGLVQDPVLKSILTNDVKSGAKFVQRLQEFITDGSNK